MSSSFFGNLNGLLRYNFYFRIDSIRWQMIIGESEIIGSLLSLFLGISRKRKVLKFNIAQNLLSQPKVQGPLKIPGHENEHCSMFSVVRPLSG